MTDSLTRQLVVFTLGHEEYALPITQVHEIIRYAEPRSVAAPDPGVRGVIALRGKIVPVFDLSFRLGITQGEPGDDSRIVMVETSSDVVGVIVDDVREVLTVPAEDLSEVPGTDLACVAGIVRVEDRLIVLLDPEGIISAAAAESAVAEAVAGDDPAAELRAA